jgi:hypothetical protein
MARRRGKTRRTRHRAGRTGVGPSGITPARTLHQTIQDVSDLRPGQTRTLECGCRLSCGPDGRIGMQSPDGSCGSPPAAASGSRIGADEYALPVELVSFPGGHAAVQTLDGRIVMARRPDGVWADPRTGEGMFGRESCEEYDRVAPDAARRFREEMSFGPDWRPIPRSRAFDPVAADEAFLDMTAHREPGKSREAREAVLRANRAALEAHGTELRDRAPTSAPRMGVLKLPRDGTFFGREACAWMDRVAPVESRRLRESMLLADDWSKRPPSGPELDAFDVAAARAAWAAVEAKLFAGRRRAG